MNAHLDSRSHHSHLVLFRGRIDEAAFSFAHAQHGSSPLSAIHFLPPLISSDDVLHRPNMLPVNLFGGHQLHEDILSDSWIVAPRGLHCGIRAGKDPLSFRTNL